MDSLAINEKGKSVRGTNDTRLTHEARAEIRAYLLRLLTIPGIIVTCLSFVIGFFTNQAIEAARDRAAVDAYQQAATRYEKIASRIIDLAAEAGTANQKATAAADRVSQQESTVSEVLASAQKVQKAAADAEEKAQMAAANATETAISAERAQTRVTQAERAIQRTTASAQQASDTASTAVKDATEANRKVQAFLDTAKTLDAFKDADTVVAEVTKRLAGSTELTSAVAQRLGKIDIFHGHISSTGLTATISPHFTVKRTDEGEYRITFTKAFATPPVVLVSMARHNLSQDAGADNTVRVDSEADHCVVYIRDLYTNSRGIDTKPQDSDFGFVVISSDGETDG